MTLGLETILLVMLTEDCSSTILERHVCKLSTRGRTSNAYREPTIRLGSQSLRQYPICQDLAKREVIITVFRHLTRFELEARRRNRGCTVGHRRSSRQNRGQHERHEKNHLDERFF